MKRWTIRNKIEKTEGVYGNNSRGMVKKNETIRQNLESNENRTGILRKNLMKTEGGYENNWRGIQKKKRDSWACTQEMWKK